MLKRVLFCFLLFISTSPLFAADLVINEFMANNDATIQDEDGDFEDWIEIYNNAPTNINLNGWHLTDDDGALTQWTFPNVTINAGQTLLVFASSKNRVNPASELHTNF
ncbi:MAG: lamin tail domain-containing protein, partial [Verrucomicrobiota bacterium]